MTLKRGIILALVFYVLFGAIVAFTPAESVDEYALDYWSTRLSHSLSDPKAAIKTAPIMDEKIGYMGFTRSGHFLYNRDFSDVVAGKAYSIVPSTHFISLYVFAVAKAMLGGIRLIFPFLHIVMLLAGLVLPILWLRRTHGLEATFLQPLALILILSPGVITNSTFVMTDGVGLFGISLFFFLLFREKFTPADFIGYILSILCMTFYKPAGLVFLPMALVLFLLRSSVGWRMRLLFVATIAIAFFFILKLSYDIYDSYLFAGYYRSMNYYLKGVMPGGSKTILQDHANWARNFVIGFPAIVLFGYPVVLFLVPKIIKKIFSFWKKDGPPLASKRSLLFIIEQLAFAVPTLAYSAMVVAVPHNRSGSITGYLALDNAAIRYLLPVLALIAWWSIRLRVCTLPKKWFPALLALQIVVCLGFPNSPIWRSSFRLYGAVLKRELLKTVPRNAMLVGAHKYEKYFDADHYPSYYFLEAQLSSAFPRVVSNDAYRARLGNLHDVLSSIKKNGYRPIVILPDSSIYSETTLRNPYQPLRLRALAEIDMAKHCGPLGRFLPENKRQITITEVIDPQRN